MPSQNRLRAQKEFQHVFKTGRRFNTQTLTWIVTSNDSDIPRFGVVLAKKNEKLAVNRNLVRRRIKEVLRVSLAVISPPGQDVVLLCSPKTAGLSFEELSSEIKEGIGLLNVKAS